ncbi:hypothetical protein PR202_ga13904 [Eleusine coracana subsp. coracana]|uniref:Uncharacterized protein n=1 Tax=Eleusine coracana subsp. coracana TaxID=191504 RepID=A0AAV5CG79_ELECO|nr:hypothetical protein PR202_ga13904 [Eleusine coracana subsp. coracana]
MEGAISSLLNSRYVRAAKTSPFMLCTTHYCFGVCGIALLTGGNKGIGLEVCRQLVQNGITVILTVRDETRGRAAIEKLRDLGLCDVNNAGVSGLECAQDNVGVSEENLIFLLLIGATAQWHGYESAVLRSCRETCDSGRQCLRTNYYGTKQVTESLLPLLQASEDGRIVNVSSELGQLRVFSNEQLKRELDDVEKLTEERLDAVVAAFEKDMEAGLLLLQARGWSIGLSAYKVSKAALNPYSRMHSGFLTPEDGGSRVVAVAMLPAGGPTGAFAFFMDGQQVPLV